MSQDSYNPWDNIPQQELCSSIFQVSWHRVQFPVVVWRVLMWLCMWRQEQWMMSKVQGITNTGRESQENGKRESKNGAWQEAIPLEPWHAGCHLKALHQYNPWVRDSRNSKAAVAIVPIVPQTWVPNPTADCCDLLSDNWTNATCHSGTAPSHRSYLMHCRSGSPWSVV